MKSFITGIVALVLVAAPAQAEGQPSSSTSTNNTTIIKPVKPGGGVTLMNDDTCLGC